jgi:hypothetical protein
MDPSFKSTMTSTIFPRQMRTQRLSKRPVSTSSRPSDKEHYSTPIPASGPGSPTAKASWRALSSATSSTGSPLENFHLRCPLFAGSRRLWSCLKVTSENFLKPQACSRVTDWLGSPVISAEIMPLPLQFCQGIRK